MSIQSQLERIRTDKETIRKKLVDFLLVDEKANLDQCAEAVANIKNNGAVNERIEEGNTYTIPPGYHNGLGTVSCVSAEGSVPGQNSYLLQAKSVDPSEDEIQTITADHGYYGLSSVKVNKIQDYYKNITGSTITKDDVLDVNNDGSTVVFLDKDGNWQHGGNITNFGDVSRTVTHDDPINYLDAGYYNTIYFEAEFADTDLNIKPAKTEQTVSASKGGKFVRNVVVEAIPANFVGDGIARIKEEDVQVNGNKVTSPAGFYELPYETTVETVDNLEVGVLAEDATDESNVIYSTTVNKYVKTLTVELSPTLEEFLASI